MTQTSTTYIVVPAPGYYGDRTRVISSHRTLDAALKAARGKGWAVYEGNETKGDEWLRVYEQGRRNLASR
ncbi:MAG TPA: hypothetical protein VF151_08490 [Gemmatimonadales bacterium]|jgi:hypothetical protein